MISFMSCMWVAPLRHASIRVHLHITVNKRQPKHPTAANMQRENHQTPMSPVHAHAHTQCFSEPPRLPQAHRPPVAPLLLRSNHQSARTPSSRPMPQSSTRTQRQPFQCSARDDDSQPHIRWRRRHLNRNERTNVTSHKSVLFPSRDPSGAAEIKMADGVSFNRAVGIFRSSYQQFYLNPGASVELRCRRSCYAPMQPVSTIHASLTMRNKALKTRDWVPGKNGRCQHEVTFTYITVQPSSE
ncbi:hypothetical protein EDB80DRAFT_192409 [Ilyonectria destructans]|nr:hypothetical protein EDB80DRAFT_192409 [Ilyonectria destructans]